MDERNESTKKVYVYVDESGSITKTNISNNRYFVIAMLFTEEPEVIRRLFKKKISQLMRKNVKYENMILSNKEIKGSDISENIKKQVYEHVLKHASDKIEVGLIVNNDESKGNVSMWLPTLCNNDVFDFSKSHDIQLNL